jgi:hypothetical protein
VQDNGNGDRLADRQGVLLQARCRKSSWHVFPVELGDISQGGCSIVGSSEAFVPGEKMRLNIAHLKPIDVEVRWIRDEKVGLEFRAALKQRVIDELGSTYGLTLTRKPLGI